MELNNREENGAVIITVTQKLDVVSAPELETYLADLIEQSTSAVILDLTDLDYISSAGLRVVLATTKKLKGLQRELFLTGLTGPVKDVVHFSGFHTIIKIFDTTAEALKNVA